MSLDYTAFTQTGLTALSTKQYYGGCLYSFAGTLFVATTARDTLFASPFPEDRGGTIDELAFYLSTNAPAGAKARMGVYSNSGSKILYPTTLVLDAGEIAIDTGGGGLRIISVSLSLDPNTLYWLAWVCTGSADPAIFQTDDMAIFGQGSNVSGRGEGLKVAFTYAALPDPFPVGAVVLTASQRLVGLVVHYSA
jgi:hypothetical protein